MMPLSSKEAAGYSPKMLVPVSLGLKKFLDRSSLSQSCTLLGLAFGGMQ